MFGFKKTKTVNENAALVTAMLENTGSVSGKVKQPVQQIFSENSFDDIDDGITARMLDIGMGSSVPAELRR